MIPCVKQGFRRSKTKNHQKSLHWRREWYIPQLHWSTVQTNYLLNWYCVGYLPGRVWHVDVWLHADFDVYLSRCRNSPAVRKIWSGCLGWGNRGSACLQRQFRYWDQSRWGFLIPASRQERALEFVSWEAKVFWRTYATDYRSILGSWREHSHRCHDSQRWAGCIVPG